MVHDFRVYAGRTKAPGSRSGHDGMQKGPRDGFRAFFEGKWRSTIRRGRGSGQQTAGLSSFRFARQGEDLRRQAAYVAVVKGQKRAKAPGCKA